MGVPSLGAAEFYRFQKRIRHRLGQSEGRTAVHRILPDLVSCQGELPARLQPAWLGRGGARPWSMGAAVPSAGPRLVRRGWEPVSRGRHRRGTRAGRRAQRRRHRHEREDELCRTRTQRRLRDGDRILTEVQTESAERASAGGSRIPVRVTERGRRPGTTRGETGHSTAGRGGTATQRCLARPARLTQHEGGRLTATSGTSPARESGTGASERPNGLLRLGLLNVQSIATKLDDILLLLREQRLDVLCLTETWLTPDVLDKFLAFPGYGLLRRDRDGRRGGGVAVLHRSEMRVTELAMPPSGPLETLWLSATWRGGTPSTIGVVYRPPDSPVAGSLEQLEEQLRAAQCTGKPVFLLGDINFNILDDVSSPVRRYLTMLHELNMTQLVNRPTHLHPSPAALDHVITDQPDRAASTEVLSDAISDHQPVIVSARLGRVRVPAQWRVARRWNRADWDAICLSFLEADWSGVDGATDANECLRQFMAVWDSVIDRFCPTKRVRESQSRCPWLTDDPELTALMAERNSARDTWLCLRTDEAKADYTNLRNAVKSRLISARRDFLCGELVTSGRREFWQNLKTLTATKRAPPADAGSQNPTEREAAADALNRHFVSVGSVIASDLRDAVAAGRENPRPPTVCAAEFRLQPATMPELSQCIRRMSASRATGLDGVPLFAVKKCFPVIAPHLLYLINLSLSTKVFPDRWKTAYILPIPKSGDPAVPSNNRPISLLSVLSKILEKVVCTQLTKYLETNCILSPRQYAYRSHHSTEDAVLGVVERLVSNIDSGLISSVTTLDLSKAFDSIDHGLLLNKLSWYGISDEWFRSYLTDRHQIVRGGRQTLRVTCGVPQGSIIGPIMFILFTTDLSAHLTHGTLTCYADDTVHVDSGSPNGSGPTELKARLEMTMRELNAWFSANSLKLNEKKTDFILVGSQRNLTKVADFSFEINGTTIQRSEKVKMLGIFLDSNLLWNVHITSVVQKCNRVLVSLYKFRHYFTKNILKTIIEAYVFPHITYGLCVWGGAGKGQLNKIQKVINFAARVTAGVKKHEHITPALTSLDWSRIETLVAHRDVTKLYKTLRMDGAPPEIRELFTTRAAVSARETRATGRGCLQLRRYRLSSSQRTFSYRAAAGWNRLDVSTREAQTLRGFKAAVGNQR